MGAGAGARGYGGALTRKHRTTTLAKAMCRVCAKTWEGANADPAQHLARYNAVDVALDTFPYNGTTTTCEALWTGVPVVSLVGTLHAGRVGLSLLSAVGLERYAVSDRDAYVAAALTLGTDPAGRSRLRSSLRPKLESSPLCDGPGFAARFGADLRTLWRRYAAPTP